MGLEGNAESLIRPYLVVIVRLSLLQAFSPRRGQLRVDRLRAFVYDAAPCDDLLSQLHHSSQRQRLRRSLI